MLIYVNFLKKHTHTDIYIYIYIYIHTYIHIYIYIYVYVYIKELLKYKYIVKKNYKDIGSKRPFTGDQDVENSFCKVNMGSF